jgi:hypothetical protein
MAAIVTAGVWLTAVLCVAPLGKGETTNTLAERLVRSFSAEGLVTTEIYEKGGLFSKTSQNVGFWYSNGWWQIEYRPAAQGGGSVSCRLVPDGVRMVVKPRENIETNVTPPVFQSANVKPITVPPPELAQLLVVWLSLCPHPQLPTTGDGHIRRLVSSEFLLDNANDGTYGAEWVSGTPFLKHLSITNDGVFLSANGQLQRFSPPFDKGYEELVFDVIATTNAAGLTLPSETKLLKSVPKGDGRSPTETRAATAASFQLTSVDFTAALPASKAVLYAYDARPPGMPKVNYFVTNEQWSAASDRRLVRLAELYKRAMRPTKGHVRQRVRDE